METENEFRDRDIVGIQGDYPNIIALCRDGTWWRCAASSEDADWIPLPQVPDAAYDTPDTAMEVRILEDHQRAVERRRKEESNDEG